MPSIPANLETLHRRIADAARKAGRDPGAVTLVAVSKTKSAEDILAACKAGQKIFGENRVQEAAAKFDALRAAHPDLRLHLIGPLQTNKAEDAVKLFDVIETLDRPRLATELARAIQKTGRAPEFYIEVNLGGEAQKAGVAPGALGDFLAFGRECGLRITGLMAIPPQHEDSAPHFNRLRELAAAYNLSNLSMGMSGDFETAIACGATEIRLGTALFGARDETSEG